jgi:type IV pilus assembly protein PilC
MASFSYTARSGDGKVIKGSVSAADRPGALKALSAQGLKPLLIKSDTPSSALGKFGAIKLGGHVKARDMVIFTRQLATMINAGVPIVRSLSTLQAQTENKFFKEKIGEVMKKVESGVSLGDALAEHPKIFSPIYVNMVKAGEEGGILDDVLMRLALQTEKDAAIRSKVKSAMAYPTVISFISIVAFYGLMTFVVPKLGKIIEGMGAPLPKLTKVMLAIGSFMRSPVFFIGFPIFVIVGSFAFRRYISTEKGHYNFHYVLLKLPIVKILITKVAIARFSRIFSSLMAAGVTVLVSIETTSGAIGNKVIERELHEAAKKVKNGTQLSAALSGSKVFPPIVSQMLAIGEETGQIDKILVKIAEFYEEEVDAFVNGLASIIEPLMIIVLGTMVGLIAASVFGPLTSLTQSIK